MVYHLMYNIFLGVEERKEKAKSTPLLTSHEDLAKGIHFNFEFLVRIL